MRSFDWSQGANETPEHKKDEAGEEDVEIVSIPERKQKDTNTCRYAWKHKGMTLNTHGPKTDEIIVYER